MLSRSRYLVFFICKVGEFLFYIIINKSFPKPIPEPIPKPIPKPFPRPISKPIPEPFPKPFPKPFPNLSPNHSQSNGNFHPWLAPHHPILNAKFPPITGLLNRSTCHKSAKGSPPPCPQILRVPQSNEYAGSKRAGKI